MSLHLDPELLLDQTRARARVQPIVEFYPESSSKDATTIWATGIVHKHDLAVSEALLSCLFRAKIQPWLRPVLAGAIAAVQMRAQAKLLFPSFFLPLHDSALEARVREVLRDDPVAVYAFYLLWLRGHLYQKTWASSSPGHTPPHGMDSLFINIARYARWHRYGKNTFCGSPVTTGNDHYDLVNFRLDKLIERCGPEYAEQLHPGMRSQLENWVLNSVMVMDWWVLSQQGDEQPLGLQKDMTKMFSQMAEASASANVSPYLWEV